MRIFEDDAMELIETMVENSHHNVAKPFGRVAMSKIFVMPINSGGAQICHKIHLRSIWMVEGHHQRRRLTLQ